VTSSASTRTRLLASISCGSSPATRRPFNNNISPRKFHTHNQSPRITNVRRFLHSCRSNDLLKRVTEYLPCIAKYRLLG
jgi:hypothetical protein